MYTINITRFYIEDTKRDLCSMFKIYFMKCFIPYIYIIYIRENIKHNIRAYRLFIKSNHLYPLMTVHHEKDESIQ